MGERICVLREANKNINRGRAPTNLGGRVQTNGKNSMGYRSIFKILGGYGTMDYGLSLY